MRPRLALNLPIRTISLRSLATLHHWLPSCDRAADGIAFLPSHVDNYFERDALVERRTEVVPLQVIQVDLCASKHPESIFLVPYTPGEIKKSFLRRALCERTQEVWRSVGLFAHPECWAKYYLLLIGSNSLDDLFALLDPKKHLLFLSRLGALRAFKVQSGKITTNDLDRYFVLLISVHPSFIAPYPRFLARARLLFDLRPCGRFCRNIKERTQACAGILGASSSVPSRSSSCSG